MMDISLIADEGKAVAVFEDGNFSTWKSANPLKSCSRLW